MIWMKHRSRNKTLFMASSPSQCYTVHTSYTRLNRFPGTCGMKQALGWWAFAMLLASRLLVIQFPRGKQRTFSPACEAICWWGLGYLGSSRKWLQILTSKFLNTQRNENAFSQYGTFELHFQTHPHVKCKPTFNLKVKSRIKHQSRQVWNRVRCISTS